MRYLDYLLSVRSRLKLTGCDILRLINVNGREFGKGGLVSDVYLLAKLFKDNENYMVDFCMKMASVGTKDLYDRKDLIALEKKADEMNKQGRMIEKSVRDLRHEMGLRKYHSIKFKK